MEMRSNTSGAEHFSSLSHQISMTSNLNSLGEKHTPHYASVAVASFAKKKNQRAFTKQYHAFV